MLIKTTKFCGSFTKLSQCPDPKHGEFAFIGRSNVGKSSLINMLCDRKALAKVSNTPGKTQTLNFFFINHEEAPWWLVDLPGYGYAKISKTQRASWEKMIKNYLIKRESLQCVMQLIDIRVPPQASDLQFINWMGESHIPFVLIFTKCDKLKPREVEANFKKFEASMLETWDALPEHFFTSATDRRGKDDVLDFIERILEK